MSLMLMITIMLGLLFVYSAVKGQDPRDVIKNALKKR